MLPAALNGGGVVSMRSSYGMFAVMWKHSMWWGHCDLVTGSLECWRHGRDDLIAWNVSALLSFWEINPMATGRFLHGTLIYLILDWRSCWINSLNLGADDLKCHDGLVASLRCVVAINVGERFTLCWLCDVDMQDSWSNFSMATAIILGMLIGKPIRSSDVELCYHVCLVF